MSNYSTEITKSCTQNQPVPYPSLKTNVFLHPRLRAVQQKEFAQKATTRKLNEPIAAQ